MGTRAFGASSCGTGSTSCHSGRFDHMTSSSDSEALGDIVQRVGVDALGRSSDLFFGQVGSEEEEEEQSADRRAGGGLLGGKLRQELCMGWQRYGSRKSSATTQRCDDKREQMSEQRAAATSSVGKIDEQCINQSRAY